LSCVRGLNLYFERGFVYDAAVDELFQANNELRTVDVININPEKIVDKNGNKIDLNDTKTLTDWIKKHYQGQEIDIIDDGLHLTLTRNGLEASAKRRGEQQRQMYESLDKLIENAVYDTYEMSNYDESTGENKKHSKIEKQNIYYSAARIGEKLYSVRIKIDIPKNKNDPNYYKDHKITEIKIEPSLYQGSSVTGAPLQNEGSITSISLAVLKGDVKPSSARGLL
jgi:acid stress-induced BolA-like protein IbaG/YrbA